MNLHQKPRLSLSLFALGHVKIHLVPVEVGVIGRTNTQVQSKRLMGQNSNAMCHDGHPVKGGLPIEDSNIAVPEVTFYNETSFQRFGNFFSFNNKL